MRISYEPIGIIRSPFTKLSGMPIQPTSGNSARGTVELDPKFAEGLKDLDGFSHIYLIYHLHKAPPAKLRVIPFLDTEKRGIFATRAPSRPDPIGLSLVKVIAIDQNRIHVDQIDVLDGTPLLDLKQFVPTFENSASVRFGWLEKLRQEVHAARSDHRFQR